MNPMNRSSLILALATFAVLSVLPAASAVTTRLDQPSVTRTGDRLMIDGAAYVAPDPFEPGSEWAVDGTTLLTDVVWAGASQHIELAIDPATTYTLKLYATDPDNPGGPLLVTTQESAGTDLETLEWLAYQRIAFEAQWNELIERGVASGTITLEQARAAIIAANERYRAEQDEQPQEPRP